MFTITELNALVFSVIEYAEKNYGKRENCDFIGVSLWDASPELRNLGQNKYMIYLCSKTFNYKYNSLAQLAHEVFHLLSPTNYKEVSVFEEGMAIYFSFQYLEFIKEKYNDMSEFIKELKDHYEKNDKNYWSAYQLILNNATLASDVKPLRITFHNKKFSTLLDSDIASVNNNYDLKLLSSLTKKFNPPTS